MPDSGKTKKYHELQRLERMVVGVCLETGEFQNILNEFENGRS